MSKPKRAILEALDTLFNEADKLPIDDYTKLVAWCMMIVQEQGQAYISYARSNGDVRGLAKQGIERRTREIKANLK